jgi:uncharacterized iron-regulated membrane protein
METGMGTRVRKVLFWSHLALGAAAGLLILTLCVTGTLMMYERQIQTTVDRWGVASHRSSAAVRPLALETVIERVHVAKDMDPESVTVFAGQDGPVEVSFGKDGGSVYADAYTGAIIGAPSAGTARFFKTVKGVHRWLGADGKARPGFRAAVNAANCVFLVLTVFGLYLWLPRRWTWQHLRAVLLLRPKMTGHARDFNWHNAIGIWAAIPLVVMIWTGMAMHYPWAKQLTYRAAGTPLEAKKARTKVEAKEEPVSPSSSVQFATLDPLLDRARLQVPGWQAIRLVVPDSATDPVDFTIDTSGYGALGKSAQLELDRTGAAVRYKEAGAGVVNAKNFIRYGHTGELWGVPGQTLMGVASLGGAFLVYTGIALSLRRYARWSSRKERRAMRAAAKTTAEAKAA